MLDLAIVTSCFNYGRYLDDWARSIVRLRTKPRLVCILDNGSTDQTPLYVEAAARLLDRAGLDVRTQRIEKTNFGRARNEAVRMAAGHEWVMHLDADDMVLPHCLCDVAKIAPGADVVGLGYDRTGDLKAGPKFKRKLYSDHQGKQTLASKAPASGVSPFRLSFWERSPYREDMDGGWDTALWIGFAHLNARFRATKRPCFLYRQHADSIFNTRRINPRKSALVGHKLQGLRRRVAGVSILVPWQPDGGARDRVWAWVSRRYQLLHPDWELVSGGCQGSWRKGTALQDALSRATGDTLILADADCVIDPRGLEEAVERLSSAPWVVPHGLVKRMDRRSTTALLQQDPARAAMGGTLIRRSYQGFAGGGIVAVDRAKYEATGGMPECFRGWGGEDQALGVILDTLLGPHQRLGYDLWHLWHPPAKRVHFANNRGLYRMFEEARNDPDALWHLLRNGGLPQAKASGPGTVVMRAAETFQRGQQVIKAGTAFTASRAEARRLAARKRRLARRIG
jgi:glycosyltransferase involved in cell wall biosynthesis